ncbi:hypothetical protein HPB48_021025 [Haemaphysalis longicornis]|uniref:DDE Tnp4 domain-containing protein n=1 Tax=Haemaphysalis longicornis TaxID=44386 RepID=A0A9J6G030_HAELO|nr:hypothetical protein HPB48_021025 [Haemaphysalis longicornis]
MAVVHSRYLFTLVDRLNKGKLNLLRAQQLPGTSTLVPDVFIGDEAFQLRPDYMTLLPGTRTRREGAVYNCRLSRVRRCVGNAFGILASRWSIYDRRINMETESAENVKATWVLHNFLCISQAAVSVCMGGCICVCVVCP